MDNKLFITIAGTEFRHGSDFLEKGDVLNLVKEPDNEYDTEAIAVKVTPLGKIGYVANSVRTRIGETMSAGRLYDKIGDEARAEVVYTIDQGVVAVVTEGIIGA